MKQKEEKKIDCEPHQALLQIVVCSCQVLHWANTGYQVHSLMCVLVCAFLPPLWSSSAVWCNQGFRIMPFPFCARLIFQIKNVKSTQMCFLPNWSAIPSTPPKTPRCRRVKSCNSAPLSLSQPALRQRPGRLAVPAKASEQLKISRCSRL